MKLKIKSNRVLKVEYTKIENSDSRGPQKRKI